MVRMQMKWAKTFHAYMANANMSAFVWWSVHVLAALRAKT